MTIDEAIERYTSNAEYERTHGNLQGCLEFRQLAEWLKELKTYRETQVTDAVDRVTIKEYIDSFNNEQMTAEDYRQRMMQAFHNADCCELIAVCVRPTEKEFEHLEWLLKNHYKKEPCGDAISRQEVLEALDKSKYSNEFCEEHHIDWSINIGMAHIVVNELKPVTPQPKMGRWEKRDVRGQRVDCCSVCGLSNGTIYEYNYCPNCGAKMEVEG